MNRSCVRCAVEEWRYNSHSFSLSTCQQILLCTEPERWRAGAPLLVHIFVYLNKKHKPKRYYSSLAWCKCCCHLSPAFGFRKTKIETPLPRLQHRFNWLFPPERVAAPEKLQVWAAVEGFSMPKFLKCFSAGGISHLCHARNAVKMKYRWKKKIGMRFDCKKKKPNCRLCMPSW